MTSDRSGVRAVRAFGLGAELTSTLSCPRVMESWSLFFEKDILEGMYARENEGTDHGGLHACFSDYLIRRACPFSGAREFERGFLCWVGSHLLSSSRRWSFSPFSLPFLSLPLYLQPPPLPIPHIPLRESGVSLSRPKHTGKVLKKARLRCAFAISSTLLSSHFFSSSTQLISYDLYHDITFFLATFG